MTTAAVGLCLKLNLNSVLSLFRRLVPTDAVCYYLFKATCPCWSPLRLGSPEEPGSHSTPTKGHTDPVCSGLKSLSVFPFALLFHAVHSPRAQGSSDLNLQLT